MLNVDNVNQFYGESHTLWDLSLKVPRASCTCLMGRNGVGKTTLLKCIMGLLPISSGAIHLAGAPINARPAELRARLGVGYVPQGRDIFPALSVEENLRIGLTTGRRRLKRIPELVFELFPVLSRMLPRRGGDLSGGQQQQLAIGRALVLQPDVLILDEPTEGIQPNVVQEIGDIIVRLNRGAGAPPADDLKVIETAIARLNKEGITVLLVEQKLPFARRVATHFHIMEKGRIVAGDAIAALSDDLVRRYLTV